MLRAAKLHPILKWRAGIERVGLKAADADATQQNARLSANRRAAASNPLEKP
jgi:hypothetical protein